MDVEVRLNIYTGSYRLVPARRAVRQLLKLTQSIDTQINPHRKSEGQVL